MWPCLCSTVCYTRCARYRIFCWISTIIFSLFFINFFFPSRTYFVHLVPCKCLPSMRWTCLKKNKLDAFHCTPRTDDGIMENPHGAVTNCCDAMAKPNENKRVGSSKIPWNIEVRNCELFCLFACSCLNSTILLAFTWFLLFGRRKLPIWMIWLWKMWSFTPFTVKK